MAKAPGEYKRKRNFELTAEPREENKRGSKKRSTGALRFVIQKHDARRLHYDFRLELDGTLKSWAIPKGPSLDPKDKRLAVHVEDHPLTYASFEGSIPHGQYGAGDVIVWDQGVWQPHNDPQSAYKSGKLKFTLIGEKLAGDWNLVRTNLRGSGDKEQWLLIKERDQAARSAEDYDIVAEQPESVLSGALVGGAVKHPSRIRETAITAKKTVAEKHSSGTTTEKVPAQEEGRSSSFPGSSPELATLVSEPPSGKWLYEIKFDGYRILARISAGEVRLFTRNGNDWTDRLPLQAKALKALGLDDSWLDGEVVVLNEQGLPDFQALQRAFEVGRSRDIIFFLFDAPFLGGRDLRQLPVEERRAELERVLPKGSKDLLRFSTAFEVNHRNIVESACAMALEGVIGKRLGSTYVSRRSTDWIKLKCRLRQEFVIVGYTCPKGSRSGFGALLLAVYATGNKPELHYAGRVGTGFNATSLQQLHSRMRELEQDESPLGEKLSGVEARAVHWITPELVCEVEFAGWTGDNRLRQARFIALRSDKPATDIIRERARPPDNLSPARQSSAGKAGRHKLASVSISHPDRVIDSDSGTRKIDLASFYADISPWLLPHLAHRPVSLLRAPDGVAGEQFFQKHSEHLAIPNITQLDPALDPGHARLMEIDSVTALVGAVQMGSIELHTWGATSDRIEQPDRIILDLDPDPALPWKSMIDAARLTLAVLDELGLDTFIKTSGGKGIHLIVPLARHASWEEVKKFARALARFMARQLPDRFVARMGPQNRVGKIFIDYLRNARGANTVSAYSVRVRPGLPVSVPVARSELEKLGGAAQWHIGNLRERLEQLPGDPWAGYKNRQRITKGMWGRLEGGD